MQSITKGLQELVNTCWYILCIQVDVLIRLIVARSTLAGSGQTPYVKVVPSFELEPSTALELWFFPIPTCLAKRGFLNYTLPEVAGQSLHQAACTILPQRQEQSSARAPKPYVKDQGT